jgi:hypothetical protein
MLLPSPLVVFGSEKSLTGVRRHNLTRIHPTADAAARAPLYGPARRRHTASNVRGSNDIATIQSLFRFPTKGGFPMTHMLKTILLTGTALAMLAAAPARSVEAVNGISPNGISPNGLNPNGLSPNGTNPNGTNPNGISPNGFAGSEHAANSAGEIGRVIAVELPR